MRIFQRVCFMFFVCLPVLSFAQQGAAPAGTPGQSEPASPPAPQAPALSPRPAVAPAPDTGKGRIRLDVVVTDKSGKHVTGLEQKDFTLLDNNLPNKILSFEAVDGSVQQADPVEVILLVDAVNIGFQGVGFARQEMEKFLRQNGGHVAQPISIFLLTDQGVSAQSQPSADGNALATEVNQLESKLRTVNRSAGAWGAIERFQFSVQMVTDIVETEAKKPGRKLLVWVGPGWPLLDSLRIQASASGQRQLFDTIVELSTRLREARISVYSISTGQPGIGTFLYQDFVKGVKTADKADPPNLGLKVLVVQTGGRVLGPDNDMAAQISSCVADAAPFYTIWFDPPRADRANEFHDLKVQIDRPGLVARTNTGYYDQP